MAIAVRFYATYRDITACKAMEIPVQGDLHRLLLLLTDKFGPAMERKLFKAPGELGPDAVILINGRHVAHLQGLNTPVQDGDVVAIFPLVAGG